MFPFGHSSDDEGGSRPGIVGIAVVGLGVFCAFSILSVLEDRNLISLEQNGGYLFMANIRCPDESPGFVDMILQTTLGVTGPVYFADGDTQAISKARSKVGQGCRLVSVIQRKPYHRIIYPR